MVAPPGAALECERAADDGHRVRCHPVTCIRSRCRSRAYMSMHNPSLPLAHTHSCTQPCIRAHTRKNAHTHIHKVSKFIGKYLCQVALQILCLYVHAHTIPLSRTHTHVLKNIHVHTRNYTSTRTHTYTKVSEVIEKYLCQVALQIL